MSAGFVSSVVSVGALEVGDEVRFTGAWLEVVDVYPVGPDRTRVTYMRPVRSVGAPVRRQRWSRTLPNTDTVTIR